MTIELYPGLAAIPPFDQDVEPEPPAAVIDLRVLRGLLDSLATKIRLTELATAHA
jgi:chromate reductase